MQAIPYRDAVFSVISVTGQASASIIIFIKQPRYMITHTAEYFKGKCAAGARSEVGKRAEGGKRSEVDKKVGGRRSEFGEIVTSARAKPNALDRGKCNLSERGA